MDRPVYTTEGTPVQQALTVRPEDYNVMNMSRLMLGVILNVYPSDRLENRSAQQNIDRHGHTHECDVLIVNDGSSAYLVLSNVIITPNSPTGMNNYEEILPRGSSQLTSGADYNEMLHQIDPFDLDGDWCVIGYVGGLIDSPFIVSWWPHSRNIYDTATSGYGRDGKTLKQSGRYFRRVNGVEHTVTPKGDIILSTTYANSKILPGTDPKNGRVARSTNPEIGGSIRAYIKDTQTLELVFDPQEDGVGVVDAFDPSLPQTNPSQIKPQAPPRENTYVLLNKDNIYATMPGKTTVETGGSMSFTVGTDYTVSVTGNVAVSSEGTMDLTAGGVLTLDGSQINLGSGATPPEAVLKSESFKTWLLGLTIDTPFGPLPVTAAYVNTLSTSPAVSLKTYVE